MGNAELRRSQIVTTFGPGAMLDLPKESVIVAGLEHWHYDNGRIPTVEEPRLVEKLQTLLEKPTITLRTPPPTSDRPNAPPTDITVWKFPHWYLVQEEAQHANGTRKRRLVHANSLDSGEFRDGATRRKLAVVPIRFVRACNRGHVGDIDWKAFVHEAKTDCMRQMWFEERGTSGDLDQVWVACECGAQRAMSQAARMDLQALGRCNGSRPWLGAGTRESCGQPNKLLIRSASNAYFPQLLSVISIPNVRKPVDDVVATLWADYLDEVETAEDLARIRRKPTPAARLQDFTDLDIYDAIQRKRQGDAGAGRSVKDVEFEALTDAREEMGADTPGGHFFARAVPRDKWDAPWMQAIRRVVLVHRLREVVAQLGFTRFEAAGPDIQGELSLGVQRAELSIESNWLPAVENRGEGLFLEFDSGALAAWAARDSVLRRASVLKAGFDGWQEEKEVSLEFPGAPYYMLHSFSHLLLTVIALECGYPASSLRERIYCMPDGRAGVLIYTGTSDAEGTLGGLVSAGRFIRRHVRRALEYGTLCSSDPVCAYHAPVAHDHQPLLGAACHGCLLVSETSCEQHNNFLDRALVVPTVEGLGTEFFAGVV